MMFEDVRVAPGDGVESFPDVKRRWRISRTSILIRGAYRVISLQFQQVL